MRDTSRHPRQSESEARREQLALESRRYYIEKESRERKLLRQRPAHVTLRSLITELQRQAMAGVMPSPAVYDLVRPAHWPTAEQVCEQTEMSWSDLAAKCGLRPNRISTAN